MYIVDMRSRVCRWCGATDEDTRVIECPACGHDSCHECMRLMDEGTMCQHTTPVARQVVVSQDWAESMMPDSVLDTHP